MVDDTKTTITAFAFMEDTLEWKTVIHYLPLSGSYLEPLPPFLKENFSPSVYL